MVSSKVIIDLSYNSAISVIDNCLKEMKTQDMEAT